MPIIKNKAYEKYTTVSSDILRDEELSITERGMLITLLSFPDTWDFSVSGLLKILPKDGKSKITASLKKLEDRGYLIRNQIKDTRGKFVCVEWEVYDTPQKPYPENRDAENQAPDNEPQYNINIINNPLIDDDDDIGDMDIYTRINYDYLYDHYDIVSQGILDDVVSDIVDIYNNKSKKIKINQNEIYPASHVRTLYDRLDEGMIRHIVTQLSMADINTDVKSYIRTTTYNTIKTLDVAYNADARHGR